MPPQFDLARALRDLARHFTGWHTCGRLVSHHKCPHCGPVTPEECLLFTSPWVQHVPAIWIALDSASRSGYARERVRAALEEARPERRR